MAKPELGEKQICPNCGAKFYDLTRRPAHCPKCETDFDPEEAVRSRKAVRRSAADDIEDDEAPEAAEADENAEAVEEEDEYGDEANSTPEIDAVDVTEPVVVEDDDEAAEGGAAPAAAEDDLGVDFAEDEEGAEEDDDVTFLEDDDEFDEDEIDGLGSEDPDRD